MSFFDIFKINEIKEENEKLKKQLEELGYKEYSEVKAEIEKTNQQIASNNKVIYDLNTNIDELLKNIEKYEKQLKTVENKLNRSKELYNSVDYAIKNFTSSSLDTNGYELSPTDKNEYRELYPSVTLKLHYMDVKELRKAYKENEKLCYVTKTFSQPQYSYSQQAIDFIVSEIKKDPEHIVQNLKEKLKK